MVLSHICTFLQSAGLLCGREVLMLAEVEVVVLLVFLLQQMSINIYFGFFAIFSFAHSHEIPTLGLLWISQTKYLFILCDCQYFWLSFCSYYNRLRMVGCKCVVSLRMGYWGGVAIGVKLLVFIFIFIFWCSEEMADWRKLVKNNEVHSIIIVATAIPEHR